jgi:hypothetical protein
VSAVSVSDGAALLLPAGVEGTCPVSDNCGRPVIVKRNAAATSRMLAAIIIDFIFDTFLTAYDNHRCRDGVDYYMISGAVVDAAWILIAEIKIRLSITSLPDRACAIFSAS